MSAAQSNCVNTDNTCLRSQNITVGSIRIEGACTRTEIEELCERDRPVNECVPFQNRRVTHTGALQDNQCRQTSRECIRYRNGKCDRYMHRFTCWNGPLNHPPAELENRVFHNFRERLVDDCGPLEANANCDRLSTEITEDYETRHINGRSVTRAWWRQERTYDCTDPAMSETCGPFESNPICAPTGDTLCLRYDADGTCLYQEVGYECETDPNFTAACENINVCVGDNCTGIDPDPSLDYPKAAAWLNVLDSLADDFGCSKDGADVIDPETGLVSLEACPLDPALLALYEPDLFAGRLMSCNRGTTNCCDFDGDGFCSPESLELAEFREAGQTHFLDSECTSEFLGTCLSVKEFHCVYNSKFARVFQEEADLQTGTQFGSPYTAEPCPALDIYQIETLDVSQMDFSELFGEMIDNLQLPVEGEITDRLTEGVTTFAPQVQEQFE